MSRGGRPDVIQPSRALRVQIFLRILSSSVLCYYNKIPEAEELILETGGLFLTALETGKFKVKGSTSASGLLAAEHGKRRKG